MAYDFSKKAALLKNGAAVYFGGLWSGPTILVDVNNFNGGPNILGKNVYAISLSLVEGWLTYSRVLTINDLNFAPYGAKGTMTEKHGYQGCSKDIGQHDGRNVGPVYQAPGAGCSYKYLYEK